MESVHAEDLQVMARCTYCRKAVEWRDVKTDDVFTREHLVLLGTIICHECYHLAGVRVVFCSYWANNSEILSIN